MTQSGASANPAGVKSEPLSTKSPSTGEDALPIRAAKQDGQDSVTAAQEGGEKKVKSAKELEKERKKQEKMAKFLAKKAKQENTPKVAKKIKEKKVPQYHEETPKGQKKILKPLDDEFHKAYMPNVVESAWYDWWQKEGFFEPEFGPDGKPKSRGTFVIVEPPPNVTGALHMGHALPNALQDTLIRWHRMKGYTTLWLPGCDHAGISTQSVVEKMLWRREKKSRYDLGREAFVKRIWEWKDEYHDRINNALKRMGGSYDWTREAFTMDENLSAAVTETFCRLHEEGIIYRENRLVNWCVALNTAISNLEVDNKDLTGRTLIDVPGYERKVEFGVLTHFCYEMENGEKIQIATTRPETMLGDTAIAVNPKDERYKHLVGQYAKHPFVDRKMPIIADDYVDMEFGTGAVKITPAHDPNDFAIGKRHHLQFINILTDDGKMNQNAGTFQGMKRFDARYAVIEALKKKGLYVKWEDNPMRVPLCSRSKDVIEPLMKPQWWMRMRELADAAIKAVEDGEIIIRPERSKNDYFRWLRGIEDWCLSRQLWWGHQAPAYFVEIDGQHGDESDGELWVTGRTEEEAMQKAQNKFPGKKITLKRDPDVLDTWFSSGLWPFSTLGWPNKTADFENFYPTSVLETGWDILFFWVARMIMLGIKMTGKVPFREVYCHSLIRDSENRKMSKSLGNVIDPLDVMHGIKLDDLHQKLLTGNLDPKEYDRASKYQKQAFPQGIPECGADALRFSLVNYTTGGGDIAFDIKVLYGYRKFCNKIYQATKYVLGKLEENASFVPQPRPKKSGTESLAERWILHEFNQSSKLINEFLEDREFSNATKVSYHYWWDELCDVYIENSKSLLQSPSEDVRRSALDTLYTALEGALCMIHPFMPFVTEELWQRLPRRSGDSTATISRAAYPEYDPQFDDVQGKEDYELVMDVSKAVRSLLSTNNVKDGAEIFVKAYESGEQKVCEQEIDSIKALCGKGIKDLSVLALDKERLWGEADAGVQPVATVFLKKDGKEVGVFEIERRKEEKSWEERKDTEANGNAN